MGEIEDIDAEKRDTERLRMKAQLDPLTGLYNASSARKRIEASLQQPPSVGMHVLAVIDVNHFKQINDTCGHLTGDHALIETARRLGSMLNEGDIAGRIGGDEFIALFRGVPSMAALEKRIDELRRGLSFPLPDGLSMSASIGIAAFPNDAADYTGLFRLADASMYADKRHRDEDEMKGN